MARNAFTDAQGVLKAHGFMGFNGGDQTPLAVPDDFALEPNRWRWDGTAFVPFVPPPPQAEPDRRSARVAPPPTTPASAGGGEKGGGARALSPGGGVGPPPDGGDVLFAVQHILG